ncbi:unnamed protein product [Pleuronectes platessa]|uniref:Uncharacterized protein n=1 Tax=Pleuronectes platessa TaxID=8262 RepID=A0A9N7UZ13_PLEPL|nr:unnamed protein product [Pleuronectes platessa]
MVPVILVLCASMCSVLRVKVLSHVQGLQGLQALASLPTRDQEQWLQGAWRQEQSIRQRHSGAVPSTRLSAAGECGISDMTTAGFSRALQGSGIWAAFTASFSALRQAGAGVDPQPGQQMLHQHYGFHL